MTDPIGDITKAMDAIRAEQLIGELERRNDRKVIILVNPRQYEVVRQSICNIRPDLESRVRRHPLVPPGNVLFANPALMGLEDEDEYS